PSPVLVVLESVVAAVVEFGNRRGARGTPAFGGLGGCGCYSSSSSSSIARFLLTYSPLSVFSDFPAAFGASDITANALSTCYPHSFSIPGVKCYPLYTPKSGPKKDASIV
ncbi:MAG: hypothetical protein V2I33_21725, partial [Kangiellaceae bacterium]|nr:hypothetical protein [Kangiellaceae bacterium]